MYLHKHSTVAVVDSGLGGISVLKQLINKLGFGNFIYYADNAFMPYGSKSKSFIKRRVENIINMLQTKYNVDLIIIACNTASSCVDKSKYSNVLTLNFNKPYTYLTTPLTKKNLNNITTIEDKSLARVIEKYIFSNKQKLKKIVKKHIIDLKLNQLNNLCLGCTHYELIIDMFKNLLPEVDIINNSKDIVDLLEMKKSSYLNVVFLTSKNSLDYINKLRLLTFG